MEPYKLKIWNDFSTKGTMDLYSLDQIRKFYDVNPDTDPGIQTEEPLTPGYGSTVYYTNILFYIYP